MKYLILLVSLIIIETLFAQNPLPQAYPCSNLSNQLNTFDGTHSNPRCINVFGNPNTIINGTQNVTLKAGETISIKDDVHITSQDSAEFHAVIEKSGFETVWFTPEATVGIVKRHHKLELGFRLSDSILYAIEHHFGTGPGDINPYNPDDIEIQATFTSENGATRIIFGFYYIPYKKNIASNTITQDSTSYNWRLRFAPDFIGQWDAVITVKLNGVVRHSQGLSFECIPSSHKGFIQRSYEGNATDRQLYFSETGETFFGIGGNVCHSSYDHNFTVEKNERHKMWLGKLADAGGNFFRLELGPQNALPDWEEIDNYTNKMQQMYLYDEIVDYAFLRELYFIMFRHHTEVLEEVNGNPYVQAFNVSFVGGYILEDYFTDSEIIAYQKKTLKYIFARWGYSPNLAIYEYQEVDKWMLSLGSEDVILTGNLAHPHKDGLKIAYGTIFGNWFNQMRNTIRLEIGNSRTMLTVAYAVLPKYETNGSYSIFVNCDLATFHKYGQEYNTNYKARYDKAKKVWKKIDKPFIIEEIGLTPQGTNSGTLSLYCCSGMTFHNDIWSTAMMGGIGCGMNWWWDRGIYLHNYQAQYKNLQLFFYNENLRALQVKPQRWDKNSHFSNTYIQNHALRSKNKTRVLGWVRNPSYHWRSHYDTDPCIKNLVDIGIPNTSCIFEDGTTNIPGDFGDADMKFPKYNALYPNAQNHFYPIYTALNISYNPVFKIKNLKTNVWQLFGFKKHWYKIEFYGTGNLNPTSLSPNSLLTQIVSTNVWSRLKPNCPNLTETYPDYAYKVTYLGKFANEPSGMILQQEYEAVENVERGISIRPVEKSEENKQTIEPVINDNPTLISENNEVSIYPNPSNGQFLIQSKLLINSIFISNLSGEEVLNMENLNLMEVEIKLIKQVSEYLLVKVVTSNNETSNLKILIHE